jgi:hypothetical protein
MYSIQSPTTWVSGFTPGVKPLGSDVYHSPPPNAEVKNDRSYTSAALQAFMAHRNIFRNTKRKRKRKLIHGF